jgi:hypothetical protein
MMKRIYTASSLCVLTLIGCSNTEQSSEPTSVKVTARPTVKPILSPTPTRNYLEGFPYRGTWAARVDNNNITLLVTRNGAVTLKPFGDKWTSRVKGNQLIVECYEPGLANDDLRRTMIVRFTPHENGAKMQGHKTIYRAGKWMDDGKYLLKRQRFG